MPTIRGLDLLTNWINGVITSAHFDMLPEGASPRGINSAFQKIGPGTATIGRRMGAELANETALTNQPAIIGQHQLRESDGTNTHILIASDGSIWKRNDNDTVTLISAAATLTAGAENFPSFAVANDLLFFINEEGEQKKFDGTNVWNFGIARPSGAPTVAASGAGSMTGDYDVFLTYYRAATDTESSASDFNSITLSSNSLQVSWGAIPDSQVTHVRVYIRKRSLSGAFYRVVAGISAGAYDSAAEGFTASPATLNITDTIFLAFLNIGPNTVENDPPPADAKYPVWHRSRIFVTDGKNIWYSRIDQPEQFNSLINFEPVNPDDGDTIIGLHSMPDKLLIHKRNATYALVGYSPASWEIVIISTDIGNVGHRSTTTLDGMTLWYSPSAGPVYYTEDSDSPTKLGEEYIAENITFDLINYSKLNLIHAIADTQRRRVLWAVPEFGSDRCGFLIPFSTRLRRFESIAWNPFDVASMALVEESTGEINLYYGNYSGHAFRAEKGYNDGIPSGTKTGKVTSATTNTLTDSTAAFYTTGSGLLDRYVYVVSLDGTSVQRRRITSNTATQLTVSAVWTTTPNTTYTYYVGGIDFQWDTPWIFSQHNFVKKRYEFFYTQMATSDANIDMFVDIFTNYGGDAPGKTRSFILGEAAVYAGPTGDGPAYYDISRYASGSVLNVKLRVGLTGNSWRARIRTLTPDTEVVLVREGMQYVLLNNKDIDGR